MSAYDDDFFHTWPENIQASYRDLITLLDYISVLEAKMQNAKRELS